MPWVQCSGTSTPTAISSAETCLSFLTHWHVSAACCCFCCCFCTACPRIELENDKQEIKLQWPELININCPLYTVELITCIRETVLKSLYNRWCFHACSLDPIINALRFLFVPWYFAAAVGPIMYVLVGMYLMLGKYFKFAKIFRSVVSLVHCLYVQYFC